MTTKHEGEREYLIATDSKYLWGTTLMYKDSAIKRFNRILENYPSVKGHLAICRLANVTDEVVDDPVPCVCCLGSGIHEIYNERTDKWMQEECLPCKGTGSMKPSEIREYVKQAKDVP